jgi:hypothetical protein
MERKYAFGAARNSRITYLSAHLRQFMPGQHQPALQVLASLWVGEKPQLHCRV